MQIFAKPRSRAVMLIATGLMMGFAGGTALAQMQPHMFDALHALQAADYDLRLASHNKGGHRLRALGLVDQAIYEVQAGIAAGE